MHTFTPFKSIQYVQNQKFVIFKRLSKVKVNTIILFVFQIFVT
ncbi:hypothetical protein A6M57_1860 [Staphylococcus pseudintermedius]|nr:hypothetical protein A6M57_1860 [Staphylococcus pseudintermedius]